ncbi:MAG: tRNA (adenosine(37)-N6)-threonylcarbamoyltransferase complex ATPase subunit type 1 TsaE, partial [Gammaproteobacteria bacterium]|nr:tRNA (adenosine(37)-N6)-threonylcarbamoyltransferase complex ATPase subunit type 1 TsaE [Gammaproteobacteria bacterium]
AGAVPSPTYTLVEPYDLSGRKIYHIDLYRIASADELEFLGWSDFDDGIRLIEWPERVPGLDAAADLKIVLSYEGNGRRARFQALSEAGAAVLSGMRIN